MWEQWQKDPWWWQSMHVWEPVRLSWDHFYLQWFAEKGWVPRDSIHSPHLGADLWAQMLAFDGTGSTQLPRPLVALLCCPRQWSVPCVCLSFLKHLTHFLPSPFFPGFYDCTLSWDPLLVQGWLIFSLFSAPSFSPPPSLKAGRPQDPLGGALFSSHALFPSGSVTWQRLPISYFWSLCILELDTQTPPASLKCPLRCLIGILKVALSG